MFLPEIEDPDDLGLLLLAALVQVEEGHLGVPRVYDVRGMYCALKSSPSEFTRSRKLKDKPVFHVMIP